MVKENKLKILVIIGISLLAYIMFKESNIILCETQEIAYEELIIELKKQVYDRLLRLIEQKDFQDYYIKSYSWLYPELKINENLIKDFIETFPWSTFIENNNLNERTILNDICKEFISYCNDKLTDYLYKKEQSYKNIIISCNHLIKEFGIFIKENPALYSWIFACMTLYKMTFLYSSDALLSAIMDNYMLNPLKSHLQLLLEYMPRLASYISIDKSSLEINNVGGYILTKQSQIAAQNTLKTIVDNSDTNITTIGFIIGVGIFIACLKYFAE